MMDAVLALRTALHAILTADVALVTLLGGARIHDEPPRAADGPYVIYGAVDARDWSTGSDSGCEQTLELVVWAGAPGASATALAVAGRIGALLHEADAVLAGHRLVNLRQTGLATRRDERTALTVATVRLRAVTERL